MKNLVFWIQTIWLHCTWRVIDWRLRKYFKLPQNQFFGILALCLFFCRGSSIPSTNDWYFLIQGKYYSCGMWKAWDASFFNTHEKVPGGTWICSVKVINLILNWILSFMILLFDLVTQETSFLIYLLRKFVRHHNFVHTRKHILDFHVRFGQQMHEQFMDQDGSNLHRDLPVHPCLKMMWSHG